MRERQRGPQSFTAPGPHGRIRHNHGLKKTTITGYGQKQKNSLDTFGAVIILLMYLHVNVLLPLCMYFLILLNM
ncbi:hypothetical protein GJAV_G00198210 [Gymnothorax javanicus]|nr:hypothetical protein GJAV_G00198210 [Gymnothorax javanicus]